METNAYGVNIKSRDLIGIPEPLNLGDDVILIVQGSVEEIKEINNHNGTKDVIYLVKGAIAKQYDGITDNL